MENAEGVRRSIQALNAGELDAALGVMAPDAEWQIAEEHPESRICRGLDPAKALRAAGLSE